MEGIEKITDRIAADTASEIEQIQQQARACLLYTSSEFLQNDTFSCAVFMVK